MKPYKNYSGNSGIKAYTISEMGIEIQFENDSIYRYDYQSNGKHAVEIMKVLAEKGIGLTTYINQEIRGKFASKIK